MADDDDFLRLLNEHTGQQRVKTIDEANQLRHRAEEWLQRATVSRQTAQAQIGRTTRDVRWSRARRWVAGLPSRTKLEPWLLTLIAGVGAALVLALPLALTPVWPSVLLIVVLLPFAVGFAAMVFAFPADLIPLQERAERDEAALAKARETLRIAEQHVQNATSDLATADRLRQGIERALAAPLQQLLSINPITLGGDGFEAYLARAFEFRGYEVTRTGKSGDQGVDLIVARDGERIAVQTKCYTHAVGNEAVQQVFAGMKHHGCQRCMVVTTSTFTSSARALSQSVECRLIEGSEIPALIRGEVSL